MEMNVKIRAGYDIAFQCPQTVPMVLMLTTHPTRDGDILTDQSIQCSPNVETRDFFDPYGNICTRLMAPPGLLEVRSEFIVQDSGLPDEVCPSARQWDVGALPDEALPFLLASRYCDTEKLSDLAWSLFGGIPGSGHKRFATMPTIGSSSATIMRGATARPPKGTWSGVAYVETLPISLSRCMNIPARYCTGYPHCFGGDDRRVACPRYWIAVVGNKPKTKSNRRSSPHGPMPTKRPTSKGAPLRLHWRPEAPSSQWRGQPIGALLKSEGASSSRVQISL
jgi:hypothetical protein